MMTFRKGKCLFESIYCDSRSAGGPHSYISITMEKHSEWELQRAYSQSFAYSTRGHICSIGGRLGTFNQILKIQSVQTKVFLISGKII